MDKLVALFNKIDARIDFFYGALYGGIGLFFGLGWFSLITIPLCALLYAMGGDDDFQSAWRDVGCSAVASICLVLATGNLLFIGAGIATFGLLTVGLGLPSTQPADDGSILGRFFWAVSGAKEWLANIYTHAFLYTATWLIYFVVSIARGILW